MLTNIHQQAHLVLAVDALQQRDHRPRTADDWLDLGERADHAADRLAAVASEADTEPAARMWEQLARLCRASTTACEVHAHYAS